MFEMFYTQNESTRFSTHKFETCFNMIFVVVFLLKKGNKIDISTKQNRNKWNKREKIQKVTF